jgi:inositol 1,4,5-triphosphate receptor type 3
MSDDFLHIGDFITVYDDVSDGYVGAHGISSNQVAMREVSDPLHPKLVAKEAVFVLLQQHNYASYRQMRSFLEREGLSAHAAMSDPRYRQLCDAVDSERAHNRQEFNQTCGREVRYGMIVQLQQESSHKYLSVSRQPAELNADGRRVVLDAEAAESAWVRIMPRLRVHSEGEKVHVGDPVTLEHVQTGLRLMVDQRLPDGRCEVIATQQALTGFKLNLFRLHDDDASAHDTLLGSQPVRPVPKRKPLRLGMQVLTTAPPSTPFPTGATRPQGGLGSSRPRPRARREGRSRVHNECRRDGRVLLQLRLATGTDRARDLSRELSRDLHSPPLASLAPLAPLAKLQTRRRVRLTRFLQVKADLLDGSRCAWTDQVRLRHVGTDCVLSVVLSARSASGAVLSAGSSRETSRRSRLTWDLARQISRDLDRSESGGSAGDDSAREEARSAPPFLRRKTSRSASRSTFLVEQDDEMVEVIPTSDLTSELSLFELVPQYQATKGHVGLLQLMRIRHVVTGYWLH